jgi:hypothetical protein
MITIQVMEIRTSAATLEILARPSRAVRARASTADDWTWTSSAYWHTRKRASLWSGSLASSQAGLDPQNVRPGTLSGPDATRLPPAGRQAVGQALCAYLSFGICWDERLNGIMSFCWPVPTWEEVPSREAAFKARGLGESDAWAKQHKRKMERLT